MCATTGHYSLTTTEIRVSIRTLARLICHDLRHLLRRITNSLLLGSLILILLGFLLTLGTYHYFASEYALLHGVSNPKYALGGYEPMLFYLCIAVSLVFALSLPNYRDESLNNVVIVYRPPSNLLLALARVLTPVFFVVGVVLATALLYQALASLDVANRPGIVEPFEPQSLMFVLVNLLVALLFWTSLATLISQLFKSSAIGFVGTFALLMIQANIGPLLPGELGSFAFGYGAASLYVSDLAPDYWDLRHFTYFVSVFLLAVAWIYAVASFQERSDPAKRTIYKPMVVTLVALCIVGQAVVHVMTLSAINQHQSWIRAFDETTRSDLHQGVVKEINGNVDIKPGSSLSLQLSYTVEFANERGDFDSLEMSTLTFGFNPGMKVEHARCFGNDMPYTHKNGILEIDVSPCGLGTDHEYTFELVARGKPVPHYLVGHIPRSGRKDVDVQMVKLMGQRSSVFTSDYVALTPLSHWYPQLLYPTSVSDEQSVVNLPEYSLEIGLNRDSWTLVTTEGRVHNAENYQDHSFVINGKSQTIGLLAADFRVATHPLESVDVNVLVHSRHSNRLDRNELLTDGLVKTIDEAISGLQDHGIDYPLDQFSIVEIPSTLSLLNQNKKLNALMKSIVTFRESGLPFVRASWMEKVHELSMSDESGSSYWEGQLGYRIRFFWVNPIFNRTYEDAIVGSLLAGRIDEANKESSLAGLVLESLLLDLLDSPIYRFDFDLANSVAPKSRINLPYIWAQRRGQSGRDLRDYEEVYLNSNAYWESIEQSLSTMHSRGKILAEESWLERRAERFRVLKMAELLGDSFDDNALASLVSSILAGEHTRAIDLDQFIDVARSSDMEIAPQIRNTLLNSELPGISFSVAKQSESEVPNAQGHRFKTVLELRNNTDIVGYVTFLIDEARSEAVGDRTLRLATNSTRLGPLEISPKSSHRLAVNTEDMLWPFKANTYLSLNRGIVNISVEQTPNQKAHIDPEDSESEWYSFVPSQWNSEENENEVIVDDLDPGFEIPSSNYRQDSFAWTLGRDLFDRGYAREEGMDNGLPIGLNPFGPWVRSSSLASWGRYRHTFALAVTSKPGIHKISFHAELPKAGKWSLSYHLPDFSYFLEFQQATLGDYDIVVTAEGKEQKLEVSSEDWVAGWNEIATLDIESAGRASVSVSNQCNQPYVFADAIKWNFSE